MMDTFGLGIPLERYLTIEFWIIYVGIIGLIFIIIYLIGKIGNHFFYPYKEEL